MSKKINPSDNRSNQQNPNKGNSGTNKQYDQGQGNRGKQQNPNKGSSGTNSQHDQGQGNRGKK